MILASRRSELTNLAHYWRRLASHKEAQKEPATKRHKRYKSFLKGGGEVYFLFCAFCAFLWLTRDEAFAKLARGGASGDAEGFGEVAAAEIADARADLRYGEIGFRK